MIKLATVFSGIGAIEHALDRMDLPHEIVFACDNGDVDILSKEISPDLQEIKKELSTLEKIINDITGISDEDVLYKKELERMLSETKENFSKLKKSLKDTITDADVKLEKKTLNTILSSSKDLKAARKKEYTGFVKQLESVTTDNIPATYFQIALDITNDYKKDNDFALLSTEPPKFKSTDGIDWDSVYKSVKKLYENLEEKKGKKLLKKMTDVCQRTGQLHEKINSFKILKELSQIKDYKQKKQLVDNLYKGKESQNKVKITYKANYKIDDDNFHWNISFLDGNQYKDNVDLFVGGSPCQSFSLVGKQRGLSDTRGTLFYEYARLIKEIQPKVFIYENVRAILSNDEGRTWETMKQVFNDLGYNVNYTNNGKPSVLNAKDYGVPQNRERMFVVGFRKDLKLSKDFAFPKKIDLNKTMKDYLLDTVEKRYLLPPKGEKFVTDKKNLEKRFTQIDGDIQLCQKKNQQFNWHGDFVSVVENTDMEKTVKELDKYFLSEKVEKYVLSSGTKNFYSKPKTDLDVARPLLTTMHKMHRAGVDNYVHTDGKLRKLTPRECLRLMGFCDTFKIPVSDTAAYQQAGNSIVVDVLIHIMNSILEVYPELNKD